MTDAPQFRCTQGTPTVVEFEVEGKKYRAAAVLAVHAVLDSGDGTADKRFTYRMSIAVDTQEEGAPSP